MLMHACVHACARACLRACVGMKLVGDISEDIKISPENVRNKAQ